VYLAGHGATANVGSADADPDGGTDPAVGSPAVTVVTARPNAFTAPAGANRLPWSEIDPGSQQA
jgi:hypothetical protein